MCSHNKDGHLIETRWKHGEAHVCLENAATESWEMRSGPKSINRKAIYNVRSVEILARLPIEGIHRTNHKIRVTGITAEKGELRGPSALLFSFGSW
jgi:hypothetical protein